MLRFATILIQLAAEIVRWWGLACRSQRSIEAENLFLRRQLALDIERGVKPWRVDSASRLALAFLSRFFRSGRGAPRDDDPLAPSGMAIVLADKVPARSTPDSS